MPYITFLTHNASVISQHKPHFLTEKNKKILTIFFKNKKITPVSPEAGNLLHLEPNRKTAPVSIRWRAPSSGRLRWSFFLKQLSQLISLNFFLVFVFLMSRFRYSSTCSLFGTGGTREQFWLGDIVRPMAGTRDDKKSTQVSRNQLFFGKFRRNQDSLTSI